jgi:radical SAM superfamily enzyme YgiQ (UPF0313 family)
MNTDSASSELVKQKALFVISDVSERVAPLVAGYLQAYACTDPPVAERWEFDQYVCTIGKTHFDSYLAALMQADADVYAFSCYVWNMGLIRRALVPLLREKPQARVILGGPQVMHLADRYLDANEERVVLCNGEGERTFKEYLVELSKPEPDLSRVRGLSFYRAGDLITTESQERIKDLDEIPSPFLNGYIKKGSYTTAHLETNRGCPFECQYCYWGGAIGAKVNKMSEQRIIDEITWLAQDHVIYIFIVDANFGMLDRDIRLSEHIVACKKQYGFPLVAAFASSKNTPRRVSQIVKNFHEAGMLSTQSIALQTLSEQALVKISRDNIKRSSYEQLQQDLHEQATSSFVELIWPLPGETFESFKSGITQLCESGAETFSFYPLFLLNNTEMDKNKEAYELVTERTIEPNSEAELVVQTKEVSRETCLEGWRLIFSTVLLYNLRVLYTLAHYLHHQGLRSYGDLFIDFAQFLKTRPGTPLAQLCDEILDVKSIVFSTLGRIAHQACHEDRDAAEELIDEFVSVQPWWQDPMARAFYEIDLINKVYVYSNTTLRPKNYPFRHISVLDVTSDGYMIRVPQELIAPVREILGPKALFRGDVVHVRHRQKQLPHMKTQTAEHNFLYCEQKLMTIGEILPQWEDPQNMRVGEDDAVRSRQVALGAAIRSAA